MTSRSLIGTELDQVPVNGMLGGLAYQSSENATIETLNLKNLADIDQDTSDTAVDVFVYDTSKDSDGGAWRYRTQSTSWYKETLNTATRGSRREFPAVAVIIAESTQITIYDGDDPDLPMWMVFNQTGGSDGNNYMLNRFMGQIKAISMLNGNLYISNNSTSSADRGGSLWINFISEISYASGTSDAQQEKIFGFLAHNISQRNTILGTDVYGDLDNKYQLINNSQCNDVAMTVLPNAPIDPSTGLPVPTIAVATDTGMSVIKDDGNVYDLTSNDVYDNYSKVEFGDNNRLYYVTTFTQILYSRAIPTADQNYGGYDSINTNRVMFPSMDHGAFLSNNHPVKLLGTNGNTPYVIAKNKAVGGREVNYGPANLGGPRPGLTFIDEGETNPSSMVAYATTSYSTGWMHGDIKGAFLSDTTVETMSQSNATELVTNGTDWTGASGTTPPNGWTSWGEPESAFTIDSGTLRIGNGAANNSTAMYQTVTTVVGQVYTFYFSYQVTNAQYAIIRVGTGSGLDSGLGYIYGTVSGAQTLGRLTFMATSTSTNISVQLQATSGNATINIDNFSVKAVGDTDRSVNNTPLQVFGTVTKSAVATGAELVAYSNFNTSDHLRQPPNSDMNIGTGDAHEMIWYKTSTAQSWSMLISYEGGATGTNDYGRPFNIRFENGNVHGWASHDGFASYPQSGTDDVIHGVSTADGVWHCAAWVRRGQVFELYVDGELIGSDTGGVGSNALSDELSELVIGARKRGKVPGDSEEPFNGSLALARIGHTAPSPEQIKKIYEDEKSLFQENAKATLYGSSDAVTALAYDDSTNLLYVGTSSGRSDFSGLTRVDHSTLAVTTAISAHDGLIAQQ